MAKAISTDFDQTVEEDVLLELVEGQTPAVQTTLQNAENVYKSFLYLRKMYSKFPAKQTILGMSTIDEVAYVSVIVPTDANHILINNFSAALAGIKINGNEYVVQIGEKTELPLVAPDLISVPVVAGDNLELKGNISYVISNLQEY